MRLNTYRLRAKAAYLILLTALLAAAILPVLSADYSFYTPSTDTQPYPLMPDSKVKSVILFIGDGMGLSQLAAARIAACGASGYTAIERMPVTGLVRTHAADDLVTDSAAAATALATGYKTNNGMISVTPEGSPLRTILEAARDKGLATGLVATCSLTHATPASFAAHNSSRGNESAIALDMLKNRVNVMLGGGRGHFVPQSQEGSNRKDDRDLLSEAKQASYQVVQTREELESAQGPMILGLLQMGWLTTEAPEPSLAELTTKAIDILKRKKKGFFMMVEGSRIDPYCHGNDAPNAIRQTLLMDQAVSVAIEFALKDKHTLVLVSNDHETGGMGINGGSLDGKKLDIKWTTTGHTGAPAPIYAFGPSAIKFTGVHDNTDVPKLIAGALGVRLAGTAK